MGELYTISQLAKSMNVRRHRIVHQLRSRNIEPARRIATVNLYDGEAGRQVVQALAQLDQRGLTPAGPMNLLNSIE